MRYSSSLPIWKRSVRCMRVICPIVMTVAIGLGTVAWFQQQYLLVAVDAFLVGVNLMLTWIQWKVFEL